MDPDLVCPIEVGSGSGQNRPDPQHCWKLNTEDFFPKTVEISQEVSQFRG
jgi:hypothetical protein